MRVQKAEIARSVTRLYRACTNKTDDLWKYFGGKGVTFNFSSIEEAVDWIYDNLGPRPKGHTLVLTHVLKPVSPGNLEWMVRRLSGPDLKAYTERIDRLTRARPDYTRSGIVALIRKRLTDDEILSRVKSTTGRPRT